MRHPSIFNFSSIIKKIDSLEFSKKHLQQFIRLGGYDIPAFEMPLLIFQITVGISSTTPDIDF
jgi:hypothetical protein